MPRIRQNKKKYLIKDFPYYVTVRMKELGLKQETVAEKLGISQPTLSYKIKNNTFSYVDFLNLMDLLRPEDKEIISLVKSWE